MTNKNLVKIVLAMVVCSVLVVSILWTHPKPDKQEHPASRKWEAVPKPLQTQEKTPRAPNPVERKMSALPAPASPKPHRTTKTEDASDTNLDLTGSDLPTAVDPDKGEITVSTEDKNFKIRVRKAKPTEGDGLDGSLHSDLKANDNSIQF